ncbi:MAG: SDR family oxidoreductase [Planctomycetota bacterium]|jgi:NAD(P)-dependent dehydrogenase (short-subunit alcohol dehydrogenase family)/rhamnose utilization protein RhaD (predicted bifunctional aldolase and dehydrogenase)
MDKALSQLIRMSRAVGTDRSLVQGGGGNTSVKTANGKHMYIKASGTALKDMNQQNGWRRIRMDPALSIIKDKSLTGLDTQTREDEVVNRLLLACDDKVTGPARPSVEAHLHAFLDKCVIHLHPSAAGAYLNAKNGKSELGKLFADESPPPLWVPYTDPGFTLAKRIAKLVDDYHDQFGKKPTILFLERHGLLISAQSPDAALRLVRKVLSRCNSKLTYPKAGRIKPASQQAIADVKLCLRKAFFEATGQYTAVSHYCDDVFAAFWRIKGAHKLLSSAILTPDELLYASGPAMWLEKCDVKKIIAALTSQINRGRKPAVAFLVKGLGLFVVGTRKIATTVRDIVAYSLFIRFNAQRMGGIHGLNKRQQDFINEWESEAFRRKLAAGAGVGQLQGRIAIVTGAGSGLGRSIALGLARAGATVGVADIDKKTAEKTVSTIDKELPDATADALPCDVTNEKGVSNCLRTFVGSWGGLDILVNAAGIAPAHPLVDMPADEWRSALEVNLTGYFLMARAAATIMIQQQMGGNIINIGSKSGLEASKDNTAYNATKAGEIHMARGWALELGDYGIRVNSIAPGNVFAGSRIWNPEYMRVCARKYGIKPEEVIPYYVSKTALKREVTGQDVADCVVFLCSEKARTITGQTFVVDAGQVMVR